jgi:hypothetical protein
MTWFRLRSHFHPIYGFFGLNHLSFITDGQEAHRKLEAQAAKSVTAVVIPSFMFFPPFPGSICLINHSLEAVLVVRHC